MFFALQAKKVKRRRFGATAAPNLAIIDVCPQETFIASTFETANHGTNKQAIEDRRAHYSNCLGWFE